MRWKLIKDTSEEEFRRYTGRLVAVAGPAKCGCVRKNGAGKIERTCETWVVSCRIVRMESETKVCLEKLYGEDDTESIELKLAPKEFKYWSPIEITPPEYYLRRSATIPQPPFEVDDFPPFCEITSTNIFAPMEGI